MKSKLLKRIGALAVAMTLVFANGAFASAAPETSGNATAGNAGTTATSGNAQKPGDSGNHGYQKDPDEWDAIVTDDYTIEAGTKTDAGYTAWIGIKNTVKADRANAVLATALQDSHVINESYAYFCGYDAYTINTANLNTLKAKNMMFEIGTETCTWTFGRVINAAAEFNANGIQFATNNDKVKALLDSVHASNYLQFHVDGAGALPGQAALFAYPGNGLLKAEAGKAGGEAYVYHYNAASGKLELVCDGAYFSDYGNVYTNTQMKDYLHMSGLTSKGYYVLATTKLPDFVTTGTITSVDTWRVKTTDDLAKNAKETIDESEAGTTVSIDVPDGLKVAKSVFEAAKKKGVKLQIKANACTSVWDFTKIDSIPASFNDFDPTVTIGEKNTDIEAALAKVKVPEGMKSITVDFAFSGVLPGTANVTLDLSAAGFADNAKVYLYYYNPQTKQLEKAAESAYVDGYATFAMTHCSQYLVTDKELQAAGGAAATPAPKAAKAPKTGDNNAAALYLVLCGIGVVAAGVAVKRKKNA